MTTWWSYRSTASTLGRRTCRGMGVRVVADTLDRAGTRVSWPAAPAWALLTLDAMSRNGGRPLKIAPRAAGQDRRAQSEVMVARRYVQHGFLDAALRIFARRVTLRSEEHTSE